MVSARRAGWGYSGFQVTGMIKGCFFGFEIFDPGAFGGRKIWQVFFWVQCLHCPPTDVLRPINFTYKPLTFQKPPTPTHLSSSIDFPLLIIHVSFFAKKKLTTHKPSHSHSSLTTHQPTTTHRTAYVWWNTSISLPFSHTSYTSLTSPPW